jgi:hypothetical protein
VPAGSCARRCPACARRRRTARTSPRARCEVRHLGHGGLHAEGHLVLGDARVELGIALRARALDARAVRRRSIEHAAAPCAIDTRRILQEEHRIAACPSGTARPGARLGRKPGAPEPRIERLSAEALGDQHDIGRQVPILGAEAVARATSRSRPTRDLRTRLEEGDRRVVVDRLGVHRLHEAEPSATFARCGSSSLSQAPDSPCRAKRKMEPASGSRA